MAAKLQKRIKLAGLVILLLAVTQIPFAYRRIVTSSAASKVASIESSPKAGADVRMHEVRGIIHAHTSIGGHSTGTFDELIAGADRAGVDFVVMTEHYSDEYDTASLTLNGKIRNTFFVGGNEIDTADGERFLMVPGGPGAAGLRRLPTGEALGQMHADQRLGLVTYPERIKNWEHPFDGIEVLNLHTEAKDANKLLMFFDAFWSVSAYPELGLARFIRRPEEALRQYDRVASERRVTLFAGTDAHSNIGVHLFGDDAGHKLFGIKLDPYEAMFRIMRMHVLLPNDTEPNGRSIVEGIRMGRAFVGVDCLGDTTGFTFLSADGGSLMGDEIPTAKELVARTPSPGRIIAYKNGAMFAEIDNGDELRFTPDGPGAYRIEAYRPMLDSPYDRVPWIMSNPIYLR